MTAAPDVVLLVDAANVVGSRPDGWWRDRAAAAARLVARLRRLPGTELPAAFPGPDGGPRRVLRVVVVLEGAARAGVPVGGSAGLDVRHAPGSGDDELAALAGPGTVLVTADRALAARATARGAEVLGPRRLLALLDASARP